MGPKASVLFAWRYVNIYYIVYHISYYISYYSSYHLSYYFNHYGKPWVYSHGGMRLFIIWFVSYKSNTYYLSYCLSYYKSYSSLAIRSGEPRYCSHWGACFFIILFDVYRKKCSLVCGWKPLCCLRGYNCSFVVYSLSHQSNMYC